jgi:hypothetical protein
MIDITILDTDESVGMVYFKILHRLLQSLYIDERHESTRGSLQGHQQIYAQALAKKIALHFNCAPSPTDQE